MVGLALTELLPNNLLLAQCRVMVVRWDLARPMISAMDTCFPRQKAASAKLHMRMLLSNFAPGDGGHSWKGMDVCSNNYTIKFIISMSEFF